ncbi:MAG: hypothetical protein HXS52_05855 [Theionarchaea archaeon]|nr:hypothetical protein [Theionarchaea archaeon]MBU7037434.1 hypothetical protein [Theionarchaea archaeon]
MVVRGDEIGDILNREGIVEYGIMKTSGYDQEAPVGHRASDFLPTARTAIVYIFPVDRDVVRKFPRDFAGESYEAYVREKKRVTDLLLDAGEVLAAALREWGFDARVIPKGSREYMGWISLKHLGYYAGLGFLGRSSLLMNLTHGPNLRIGAVLTDCQPQDLAAPAGVEAVCRDCKRCITACPAHALEVPREGELYRISKEKCHRYFCRMKGITYSSENANVVCGLCRQVCPVGT